MSDKNLENRLAHVKLQIRPFLRQYAQGGAK